MLIAAFRSRSTFRTHDDSERSGFGTDCRAARSGGNPATHMQNLGRQPPDPPTLPRTGAGSAGPHVCVKVLRFKPALARTFRPGSCSAPRAAAAMFRTPRSSTAITPKRRTILVLARWQAFRLRTVSRRTFCRCLRDPFWQRLTPRCCCRIARHSSRAASTTLPSRHAVRARARIARISMPTASVDGSRARFFTAKHNDPHTPCELRTIRTGRPAPPSRSAHCGYSRRYRLGGDDLDKFSVVKKYFAHAGLAVAPDERPLGVLFSLPWTTDPDMTTYWARRHQASLSQFGLDMAHRLASRCPKVRVHLICDVADGLYDLFAQYASRRKDVNLLVRATRARKIRIESPSTGRPVQAVGHLAATTPVLRHCPIEVGRGRNTQGRDLRTTHVSVNSATVGLLAPVAQGRYHPVYVTAILVTEDDPPPNRRRLEWLFLSSSLDLDAASICECLSRHEHRWTFDEFFRVLNAGTRRERRTLCDYYGYLRETDQLESWLASDSVHAWRVLGLLRLMHVTPHLPAEEALESTELACLYHALRRDRDLPVGEWGRSPAKDIRSAVIDIGRLSGFLPSKRRVLPGREVVWRGYERLRVMSRAYELAQARP